MISNSQIDLLPQLHSIIIVVAKTPLSTVNLVVYWQMTCWLLSTDRSPYWSTKLKVIQRKQYYYLFFSESSNDFMTKVKYSFHKQFWQYLQYLGWFFVKVNYIYACSTNKEEHQTDRSRWCPIANWLIARRFIT